VRIAEGAASRRVAVVTPRCEPGLGETKPTSRKHMSRTGLRPRAATAAGLLFRRAFTTPSTSPRIPMRRSTLRFARAAAVTAAALLSACSDAPTAASPARLASSKGSSSQPAPTGGATSVVSVTVSPAIVASGATAGYVVGGTSGTGTVTLGAATTAPVVVSLSSDNGYVMPVPASVTVPAGQRSAAFPVATLAVTGTFTLNVSAGVESITASARVYVVPTAQTDIIAIPRLDLSAKRTSPPLGEVKIEATSTDPSAVLRAEYAGQVVATLTNNGGGRYSATFTVPTLDGDIVVRSQFGGCAVRATNRPTGSRSCPSL
jgi:hypothetical protein